MKITVIGTGYVGLVTGACLAEVGNEVLCLDLDPVKIDLIKSGVMPIFEPGLEAMVKHNVGAGRLGFTTDVEAAVHFGEIQFVAVGTPPDEDGSADLQYVLAAVRNIARHMQSFKLVVDKSTVPVGTADRVKAAMREELQARGESARTLDFCVASNPEFLKEGAAIEDFMKPDRIVLGTDDERSQDLLRQLYAPFNRNRDRIVAMDVRSAELTKYAANAMLATRISFMNELAVLAEALGADIEQVRHGIGSDPRIGYHFLYAGCGYGGSCFPKDVQALQRTARDLATPLRILAAVEAANEAQKQLLVTKIRRRFDDALAGRRFALWGLAFKPNTDDLREAPSRVIIESLLRRGASVSAYDPAAMQEARRIYRDRAAFSLADDAMATLEGADALVIVTEWKEFRSPNFAAIKALLKAPLIFDGRNLFDPALVRAQGFEYFPIGRRA